MTFTPWCYSDKYAAHGETDFADVIKVSNQMTLRLGDYPGLLNRPNLITQDLKSRNPTPAGNVRENKEFEVGKGRM